jgi:hypothetical protein
MPGCFRDFALTVSTRPMRVKPSPNFLPRRVSRRFIRRRLVSALELVAEPFEEIVASGLSSSAFSTRACTSSRRMIRWLSHPQIRAPKRARRLQPVMMKAGAGLHRVPGLFLT